MFKILKSAQFYLAILRTYSQNKILLHIIIDMK